MNNENPDTRASLQRLAEELKSTPRYCDDHKPCAAKEHNPGVQFIGALGATLVCGLTYGLFIMWGVNGVLNGWLEFSPKIDYFQAVTGWLALRSITFGIWKVGK